MELINFDIHSPNKFNHTLLLGENKNHSIREFQLQQETDAGSPKTL